MKSLAQAYIQTIDFQNDVYRQQMRSLSPQQQKIINFLAERQCAVTVKEIAKKNFLTHQTVSSQLKKLLENEIVERHSFGRESYYGIADINFRHWLDLKAHRQNRIINWCNFLESHYNINSQLERYRDSKIIDRLKSFDSENITTESDLALNQLLEFWFLAQELYRKDKNK